MMFCHASGAIKFQFSPVPGSILAAHVARLSYDLTDPVVEDDGNLILHMVLVLLKKNEVEFEEGFFVAVVMPSSSTTLLWCRPCSHIWRCGLQICRRHPPTRRSISASRMNWLRIYSRQVDDQV